MPSVGIVVTTTYLYDVNDERIAEGANGATTTYPFPFYNVQGSTITKHIFANGEPVADIVTGGSASSSSSITFDASSTSITTGFNSGPVTKTWTQACNSCSLIVLNAGIWQDTGPIGVITSAKVGGAAMTFVASTTSTNIEAEQWYFLATSTGTQNISVTVTGATDAIKMATASFKGTMTSSPLDTSTKTTGTSGNPSLSLTTGTTNDLVIDTLDRYSTTNATTNQTAIYNDHVTSTLGAASYQIATTTKSYSDTYTGSASQDWAMVMAAFKQGTSSASSSPQVYYIHDDALGGANVLSNASGTVAEVLEYYPFGGMRFDQRATSFGEQRRFTGHEFDTGTGLNYMDARYEAPTLSRFLNEDPMFLQAGPANWQNSESADPQYAGLTGFVNSSNSVYLASPQNINPYSYVDENPLKYTDPSGKQFCELGCADDIAIALFVLNFWGNVQTFNNVGSVLDTFSGSGSLSEKFNSPDTINLLVDASTRGITNGASNFTDLEPFAKSLNVVSTASGLLGDDRRTKDELSLLYEYDDIGDTRRDR